MIGLADRFEPWARRFQPPPAPAPQEAPRRPSGRVTRDLADLPLAERAERKEGRFARRALQER